MSIKANVSGITLYRFTYYYVNTQNDIVLRYFSNGINVVKKYK